MNLITTCKKNVFECANKVEYCFDMKSLLSNAANSTTSIVPSTTAHSSTTAATTAAYIPTTTLPTTTTDYPTTTVATTPQSTTTITEPLLPTTAHTNHLTKTDVVAIAVSIVFMIVFIVGIVLCYVSLTFDFKLYPVISYNFFN